MAASASFFAFAPASAFAFPEGSTNCNLHANGKGGGNDSYAKNGDSASAHEASASAGGWAMANAGQLPTTSSSGLPHFPMVGFPRRPTAVGPAGSNPAVSANTGAGAGGSGAGGGAHAAADDARPEYLAALAMGVMGAASVARNGQHLGTAGAPLPVSGIAGGNMGSTSGGNGVQKNNGMGTAADAIGSSVMQSVNSRLLFPMSAPIGQGQMQRLQTDQFSTASSTTVSRQHELQMRHPSSSLPAESPSPNPAPLLPDSRELPAKDSDNAV
jgi:hypothetical protein